jgi:hypothetical protein
MMIALTGPDGLSPQEESWLTAHLESCATCRKFAENTRETVRALRGVSVTADVHLVSRTQLRLRQRARELQGRQERLWMVTVCVTAVMVSTLTTTAMLWRVLSWLGQQVHVPALLWQGGLALSLFVPTILIAIFLLARGTHLAEGNGAWQE